MTEDPRRQRLPERFLGRVGLGSEPRGDDRFAERIVVGVLLVYALSMALYYPAVATNIDEAAYLHQTICCWRGAPPWSSWTR